MSSNSTFAQMESHNPDQNGVSKVMLGFWVYLMTDLVLFASIFATFAVLRNNTFGGPGAAEIFSLPYVFLLTLILLTSSYTSGLGILAAHQRNKAKVLFWFGVTFVLGTAFLVLELNEFAKLVHEGNGWTRSGFLSAFFTLVGTHGLHITAGLIWMAFLMLQTLKRGLSEVNIKRFTLLSMFWHFLDIVWIFIFTIVYLLGFIKL